MADLQVESLRKTYGSVTAVRDVSLRVPPGEFLSLVGPSGCGKTTVLRMMAGLIEPDAGRILVGGRDITFTPTHRRNVGLVFQSYALFPHMSVFENVAFGLRRRKVDEAGIRARAERILELVHLGGLERRFPRELSGGQQQRVALARALVTEPAILLLDEPLSNLDKQLRDEMRVELKRLQQELSITTVFVTHDQAEALTLSDKVAVMNHGRLEQLGTPEEIYRHPANVFVASFVGRSNFFLGIVSRADGGLARLRLDSGLEVTAASQAVREGSRATAAVRQESIRLLVEPTREAANSFRVTVLLHAFAGSTSQYVVALHPGVELRVESPSQAASLPQGSVAYVEWASEDVTLLPAEDTT